MIYYNAHEIIGWYTSKGKNNVERGTAVTACGSDIGTGERSMSYGGGEDGAGYIIAYPHPPLGLSNRSHRNILHNRDSYMDMEKKK